MEKPTPFEDRLRGYLDAPIAILCMRYWYRGILSEVGTDYVVLTNARAVEITGRATNTTPQTEDVIPSDVLLKTAVIEIVCWPTWVSAGMDAAEKPEAKGAAK